MPFSETYREWNSRRNAGKRKCGVICQPAQHFPNFRFFGLDAKSFSPKKSTAEQNSHWYTIKPLSLIRRHQLSIARHAIYVWLFDFSSTIHHSWLSVPSFDLSSSHCILIFSPRSFHFHHLSPISTSDPYLRVYDAAARLPVQGFGFPRTLRCYVL